MVKLLNKYSNQKKRRELIIFSRSEIFNKWRKANAINRLSNIPAPKNPATKNTLSINTLPTSKIIDENGRIMGTTTKNLGDDKKYIVPEYRYKFIAIPKNNILPPNEFKTKYLSYKKDLNRFETELNTFNDSLDNEETNTLLNHFEYLKTAKIDRTAYTKQINNLICSFIEKIIEPTILHSKEKDIIKHIKSYTGKAKYLNWTKTACITRLTQDKHKYYNSVKNELIKETITNHWNKAKYNPRWQAIITNSNLKHELNRFDRKHYGQKALEYFYVRWWSKISEFGKNDISLNQMVNELSISKRTAKNILDNIKIEQGKTLSKGENTKEKVKNWFIEHGNYRGSNKDCSQEFNLSIKAIEKIKINSKKKGFHYLKLEKNSYIYTVFKAWGRT